jgi:hypothetical protein
MKGVIFTLDAIVAFGIIIAVIGGLILFRSDISSPFIAAQQLHSISEDILTVLSDSDIKDVVSQNLLNQYLANGVLNQSDLNKKTIDILGALWSAGKKEEAKNITRDVLNNFIPNSIGYQLLINGDDIYNSSDTTRPKYENASVGISSSRVVSGYEKYKPTSGYVARALARRANKNNTLIVMGDVVSSSVCNKDQGNKCAGSNQNDVYVYYNIDVPDDATILDAYWFIESASVDNNFKAWINGQYVPGSAGSGNALVTGFKNMLHTGHNLGMIDFWYQAGSFSGGDDGATHIVVTYNTSKLSTLENYERQYFQSVNSNCSVEYKKPIFVPGSISEMAVRLNVVNGTKVKNVTLSFMWNGVVYPISIKNVTNGIVEWNNTEIKNVLDSKGISYTILKGRFFWFIADIDVYHKVEDKGYGRMIDGNDSYVSVNYTIPEEIYNFIDITKTLSNFTYADLDTYFPLSDFYRYVRWNFNLTHKIPLLVKWQFAWGYSPNADPNPKQLARANKIVLYNHDPNNPSSNPLIIAFARFGYDTDPQGVLISSDNIFELNFTQGYSVNPVNSLGGSTFFIPASVGYGNLFANVTDARNDAIQRLQNLLGTDISVIEMVVDSIEVSGVPYMWGPVAVKLLAWV